MGAATSARSLPVGVSSFERLVSGDYCYVDKTLLVRDVLEDGAEVVLFCRPRRFGKTLNLDMLRHFFEMPAEGADAGDLFAGMLVSSCGEEVLRHQGKYPVVWLTFKDVKYPTWEGAQQELARLVAKECRRHRYLEESEACDPEDRKAFLRMLSGDDHLVGEALEVLTRMLAAHHGVPCVLLVDEYDTPVNEALHYGYYDEAVRFMRVFLSGGLKDNPALFHGYLTGILRVAKEGIFSGLNNLKVDTVLDSRFAQYFGFTREEARTMCEDCGVPDKYTELCSWYDGYRFGDREMFNPWSVINYFSNDCKPRAYWVSTSSNSVIADVLGHATPGVVRDLTALMEGGSVTAYVHLDAVYPRFYDDVDSAYSLLLMSGYLTVEGDQLDDAGELWSLRLPNRELALVYRREIMSGLGAAMPSPRAKEFGKALVLGDAEALQASLEGLLLESASYFDTASEAFYHGLVLGLVATVDGRYRVESNREAGEGRFDIAMEPADAAANFPGIIIELKAVPKANASEDQLDAQCQAAVDQIRSRQYFSDMKSHGGRDVLAYGVAFGGKRAKVQVEKL